jgi:AAA-like domain/TIR domain
VSASFQVGGPLLADSPVYVTRDSDKKACDFLSRMEYITLVEPRQHGKTSLINRLIGEFKPKGFAFALCDLMAAKASNSSCNAWYTSLGLRMLAQLDFIPDERRPTPPIDSLSWETFLAAIANEGARIDRKVVVALDEIGAMPTEWATNFFSIIRSVYTTRQSCLYWRHLTFIISGAFNPRDLIMDKTVSNFNVDQRVILHDFDIPQVRTLVERIGLPTKDVEVSIRRIHHWADGQPYLTQYLCKALMSRRATSRNEPIESVVDEAVETLLREDTSHLARILELQENPALLAYFRKITSGTPSRFSAGLNEKQFRLAHILGVIKPDPQDRCQIRNRIYQRALEESHGLVDEKCPSTTGSAKPILACQKSQKGSEATSDKLCTSDIPNRASATMASIFLSYSHKDAKYKEEFERHMAPLRKYHDVESWSDEDIPVSSDWRREIENAMEHCGMAVALVTSSFLSSHFCMDVELREFVKARAERGLKLVAVVLSDCYWQAVPDLARYQLLPRNGAAIKSARNREQAWSKVVKEIGNILGIQLL